jgi:hypothetical protein
MSQAVAYNALAAVVVLAATVLVVAGDATFDQWMTAVLAATTIAGRGKKGS